MLHIIFGLFFIALGIWGLFDEWYYVVDFIKGGSTIFLIMGGIVAILFGVINPSLASNKMDQKNSRRDLEVT